MNNYMIHKALDKWLETAAGALSVPVAWENMQFTPPKTGIFLEADFLPADNQSIAIQGRAVVRRGVYQVTVVYPIGKGSQSAEKIAVDIVAAFQEDTAIPTEEVPVYVIGEPAMFQGIKDATGYRIPVSIAYAVTA